MIIYDEMGWTTLVSRHLSLTDSCFFEMAKDDVYDSDTVSFTFELLQNNYLYQLKFRVFSPSSG